MYSQAVYGDSNDTYPVYMPMGLGYHPALWYDGCYCFRCSVAKQTGKGDRVSLSLYGTAAWLANILVSGSQYGFKMPKRRENSSPFGAPFKCSDGWFMPQVVVFNRDTPIFYHLVQTMIGNPACAPRAKEDKYLLSCYRTF